MWTHPRIKYVCISCRLVFRESECCSSCRGTLRRMYNFQAPPKRDAREWKKIEIRALAEDSGLQMCTWGCCVPIKDDFKLLTLSQYKTRVKKRLNHRQGGVPKHYNYR